VCLQPNHASAQATLKLEERTRDAMAQTIKATVSELNERLALLLVERPPVEDITSQKDLHLAQLVPDLALAPIPLGEAPPMPLELLVRCEALPPLALLA